MTSLISVSIGQLEQLISEVHPYTIFQKILTFAKESELPNYNRMLLATFDSKTKYPYARFVLLKKHSDAGLVFYTNYNSPKAKQMDNHPQVALNFYWEELRIQIRILGNTSKISEEESDAYFASRSRLSQLAAWASQQSEKIMSHDQLEEQVQYYSKKFASGAIPRPPFWGGYRVVPTTYEFWQAGEGRLHDRFKYTLNGDKWLLTRLSP